MDEDTRQRQYEHIRDKMLENLAAQGIAPPEGTDEHYDLRRMVNERADGPGDARVYSAAELDEIAADQERLDMVIRDYRKAWG
ncbi:MAG: hypothetical protein KDB26_05735 [Microthrixaceae bacterium]|nr:hypothetical protein [Microthrixaceae bacterium]